MCNVITSYSIHYTKLYDPNTLKYQHITGRAGPGIGTPLEHPSLAAHEVGTQVANTLATGFPKGVPHRRPEQRRRKCTAMYYDSLTITGIITSLVISAVLFVFGRRGA